MDAKQLTDELHLKAMTALTCIIQDEQRGIISPAQAATGVRAIFDTVGGLVPTEAFDLISLVGKEYKGKTGTQVDMVKVGDHLEGVIRFCHSGAVLRVTHAVPHRRPAYTTDEVDAEAKVDAANLFNVLKKKVNAQW